MIDSELKSMQRYFGLHMGRAGLRCFFFPELVAKETQENWTWLAMKAIRPAMGKYQWFLHTPGTILASIEPV